MKQRKHHFPRQTRNAERFRFAFITIILPGDNRATSNFPRISMETALKSITKLTSIVFNRSSVIHHP